MGAFTKQLSNFIWASIANAQDGKSVLEHMKNLEMREASQLDRAIQINEKLARLTGKQEYWDKVAQLAEKQTHLHLANSKELREAYKNLAKEIRNGNIPKENFKPMHAPQVNYNLNFNNSIVNIADKIRSTTQEVKNLGEELSKGLDKENLDKGKFGKDEDFEKFKEQYMQDKEKMQEAGKLDENLEKSDEQKAQESDKENTQEHNEERNALDKEDSKGQKQELELER